MKKFFHEERNIQYCHIFLRGPSSLAQVEILLANIFDKKTSSSCHWTASTPISFTNSTLQREPERIVSTKIYDNNIIYTDRTNHLDYLLMECMLHMMEMFKFQIAKKNWQEVGVENTQTSRCLFSDTKQKFSILV